MNQQVNKEISFKNIRATALKEFWGKRYKDSIYLWPGAKHDLNLEEMEDLNYQTYIYLFSTKDEINRGYENCVNLYYKFLPYLAKTLNEIHKLNLSNTFWQIAFGAWLFRHICNAYEKYSCLENLDENSTSLFLLEEKSFYIPQNHYDYLLCFSRDFGVQQLVSQYFNLKEIKYPVINKIYAQDSAHMEFYKHTVGGLKKLIKRFILNYKINPQIALLGVNFSSDVVEELVRKSSGMINHLFLPPVSVKRNRKDLISRRNILKINADNQFERYLLNTLVYCTPKDYIENFKEYYLPYLNYLEKKTFTHIVSEVWVTDIPHAIYVALAKERNRLFITYEHGSGLYFYKNDDDFFHLDVADKYISVGWHKHAINLVQGGFASRFIEPYNWNPGKKEILYISRTMLFYNVELLDRNNVDSFFNKQLKAVDDFIKLLPDRLKKDFTFKPRKEHRLCWDTEYLLDLKKKKINIATGDFSQIIHQPRIIVIDHLSTGLAEILLIRAPFILLYDINSILLFEELNAVFEELIDCGVVHLTAQSAVNHLSNIYDNVHGWWQSVRVQQAINQLKDMSLAPASKTTDYLLSLLN